MTSTESTIKKAPRKSGVELLRILSLLGITLCHTMSSGEALTGINKYLCILGNSGIHAGVGVICFMLITGYFGAHFSLQRLNKSYSIIYICSLVSIAYLLFFNSFSAMSVLKRFIPVTSRVMWYASCYIFTMLLSPFLDELAERIDKKTFQKLLVVLIALFYAIPTFMYFDITNDKGKGLLHMLVCYLIGRYLRKYPVKLSKKALIIIACSFIIISFVGNCAATIVAKNISWPFSRDCTLTCLGTAVALFLLSTKLDFISKPINYIAKYSFYIYLLDLYTIFKVLFKIDSLTSSAFYFPVCIAFSVFILLISTLAAIALQYPARLIELLLGKLEELAEKIILKIKPSADNIIFKLSKGEFSNGKEA